MPSCPECGSECRETDRACPNCGRELTGDRRFSDEPLAVVYEAPNQLLSRLVKATLENAGVPVVEHVDRTAAYGSHGLYLSMVGRYSRLLTVESRAEQAREIVADFLAAYERGDLALPEEEAGADTD